MTGFGWPSWMLTATVLGASAGLFTAARTPSRYRSEALILVVPPRAPEAHARPTVAAPMSADLASVGQEILSRTGLERVIQEFNMYPEERRRAKMEDVIEMMRKNVGITPQSDDSFRVDFVGTEPRTVMKVAGRLAALLIAESLHHRELLAESANQFLQDQLEELRPRLIRQKRQLNAARHAGSPQAETMAIESEVLEATFKDLLTKVEDSQLAMNLERGQIGEQFKLLDPARAPERPFSPDRRLYTGVGAAAGLAAGLLLSIVLRRTRLRGKTQQRAVPVEA